MMHPLLRYFFSFLIGLCCFTTANAQANYPFYKEVQAFKKQDSLAFPAPNQVLLIGSSSFTMWRDVQNYFPNVPILNRAFGGSDLSQVLHYQEDVIFPYKPRHVVVYCGENDFNAGDTLQISTVVGRFKQLFANIRERMPKVPITYVSIKPSPSRRHNMARFHEANVQIDAFIKTQKRAQFVDVYHPMLLPDGQPNPEIFIGDSLHMNAKGYAIWQEQLKKPLRKK